VLSKEADRYKEFEELVLWVVVEKPGVETIAKKLEELTTKYQKGRISKFVERMKALLTPVE
jgi:hypothetical protein